MLHYCVRLGMGTPLFGHPTARLLHHHPLAGMTDTDAPWSPATPMDIGMVLPDGIYAAYVRMAIEMPGPGPRPRHPSDPRHAIVCVRDRIAVMVVLGTHQEQMYMQRRGQVVFVMIAPVLLGRIGTLLRSMRALERIVQPWFHSRPDWWCRYHVPRAFDVLLREWKQWQESKSTTTSTTTTTAAAAQAFDKQLLLLTDALRYIHPLRGAGADESTLLPPRRVISRPLPTMQLMI